jgi:zinc transport system substrate-binding protein
VTNVRILTEILRSAYNTIANNNIYDLHTRGIPVNWRKLCLYFVAASAVLMMIGGCASSKDTDLVEGKINVITTFYPLYDFAVKIGGEHAHVINLVPAGVDSHDWSPKSKDVQHIQDADLFIYNGLGFEGWTDRLLAGMEADTSPHVVLATKGIDLLKMDEAHHDEAGHEHEHGTEEHDEHDGEYDPHAWLSPLQARKYAENIKEGFIAVDPEHQADYEANYAQVAAKLDELHEKFKRVTESAERKDIVVSHHAYGYLARDYGLRQLAVMGMSPEAEPTAHDIKNISEFIREHEVKYILFEELVSPKLAETLAKDLNIGTLVFNPVEGLTAAQEENGEDYFSLMEKNLQTLEIALQK